MFFNKKITKHINISNSIKEILKILTYKINSWTYLYDSKNLYSSIDQDKWRENT